MATQKISAPGSASPVTVAMTPNTVLQFDFPVEDATFERSGTDLSVSFDDGGQLVINDFFVAESSQLPVLVLADGTEVPSEEFLSAMNPELNLEPAGASVASSGLGEYSDAPGELIGGMDRLGSLGTTQWSGEAGVAEEYMASSSIDDAGEANVPPAPPVTPPIVPPTGPNYVARAVAYLDDGNDRVRFFLLQPDGAVAVQSREDLARFDFASQLGDQSLINMDLDNLTIYMEDDPALATALAAATDEDPIDPYAVIHKDGSVSFPLSDNFSSQSGIVNHDDYIDIKIDGHEYTMQVIVNDYSENEWQSQYRPQDAEDLRPSHADQLHEWHNAGSMHMNSDITAGSEADYIWMGPIAGGTGNQYFFATGDGDDHIYTGGKLSISNPNYETDENGNYIYQIDEDGNSILNKLPSLLLDVGDGNNTVVIGDENQSGVHRGAGEISNSATFKILAEGSGDNTIDIHGSIALTTYSDQDNAFEIQTGAGNDTVNWYGGIYSESMYGNFKIDLGDGDNKLVVEGEKQPDGTAGDDAITLKGSSSFSVITGSGDDTIELKDGIDSTSVSTGAGKDNVLIETHFGAASSGINVDLGADDDYLTLKIHGGEKYSVAKFFDNEFNGGEGNDILHLDLSSAYDLPSAYDPDKPDDAGTRSGEILSRYDEIFDNNTISGFEQLIVDITNGKKETLPIDDLLAKSGDMQLFVQGDGVDTIDMPGWTVGDKVTFNGVEYVEYTSQDESKTVLIQDIIQVTG